MGTMLEDLHHDLHLMGGRDGQQQAAILQQLFGLAFMPDLTPDPAATLRRKPEFNVEVFPVLEDAEGVLQKRLPLLLGPDSELFHLHRAEGHAAQHKVAPFITHMAEGDQVPGAQVVDHVVRFHRAHGAG